MEVLRLLLLAFLIAVALVSTAIFVLATLAEVLKMRQAIKNKMSYTASIVIVPYTLWFFANIALWFVIIKYHF